MIEAGLEDLSISRSQISWGVPVPWDPEQVIYVWVDALFNYWTALGYGAGEDGGRFWPPTLQLMAKDILKFHAVIWPALLLAADIELPERLAIHGYVLKGGEKMSKTTGNLVDPFPFIEDYGIDALRYYLAREIRFGEDGTFSAEGFDARYNGELANELGNLLNRTVSMIGRYRDGVIPADHGRDTELAAEIATRTAEVADAFDGADITRAVEATWVLVRDLNRLVEQRAPWVLAKDPDAAADLDQVLFTLAAGLKSVLILMWPVIPGTSSAHSARSGRTPPRSAWPKPRSGPGSPDARSRRSRRCSRAWKGAPSSRHHTPIWSPARAGGRSRARRPTERGVSRIVAIGMGEESSRRTVAMAEAYAGVWAAVGVHPNSAAEWRDDDVAWIAELAGPPARSWRSASAGWTSTGIARPRSSRSGRSGPRSTIARATGLPLVIHTRDAERRDPRDPHRGGRRTHGRSCTASRWWITWSG